MRSPFSLFLLSGLLTSSAALLPVLARELETDTVRDSLAAVLTQPITPSQETNGNEAKSGPDQAEPLPSEQPESTTTATVSPVPVIAPAPAKAQPQVVSVSTGEASWYGPGFYGNRTASGEVFRRGTMTAAHRTLPFGTKVRVTNLWNGRTAVVRINDRGPFVGHRLIDLGHGAATELGLVASGIAQVRLEVLR